MLSANLTCRVYYEFLLCVSMSLCLYVYLYICVWCGVVWCGVQRVFSIFSHKSTWYFYMFSLLSATYQMLHSHLVFGKGRKGQKYTQTYIHIYIYIHKICTRFMHKTHLKTVGPKTIPREEAFIRLDDSNCDTRCKNEHK